eukprot:TRINITY_DN1912_c0_g2_i1.p1 TRINITY_DN1912_c0_g2~~TRINITY_DN1912_c0_g2_i1.p1  ORF type:complete len:401 (-),score=123.36 TRINITY_DN1912_c0_g2_i1:92-1120(-)
MKAELLRPLLDDTSGSGGATTLPYDTENSPPAFTGESPDGQEAEGRLSETLAGGGRQKVDSGNEEWLLEGERPAMSGLGRGTGESRRGDVDNDYSDGDADVEEEGERGENEEDEWEEIEEEEWVQMQREEADEEERPEIGMSASATGISAPSMMREGGARPVLPGAATNDLDEEEEDRWHDTDEAKGADTLSQLHLGPEGTEAVSQPGSSKQDNGSNSSSSTATSTHRPVSSNGNSSRSRRGADLSSEAYLAGAPLGRLPDEEAIAGEEEGDEGELAEVVAPVAVVAISARERVGIEELLAVIRGALASSPSTGKATVRQTGGSNAAGGGKAKRLRNPSWQL